MSFPFSCACSPNGRGACFKSRSMRVRIPLRAPVFLSSADSPNGRGASLSARPVQVRVLFRGPFGRAIRLATAAVPKTAEGDKPLVGSTPTPSAKVSYSRSFQLPSFVFLDGLAERRLHLVANQSGRSRVLCGFESRPIRQFHPGAAVGNATSTRGVHR